MQYLVSNKIVAFKNDLTQLIRDVAYLEIQSCIQCGACSGSCPSGKRTALRTRGLIRKVIIGFDDVLSDAEIWLCTTCYTCAERCPRSIPITDTIIFLRNLAVKKGHIQPSHLKLCEFLFTTGHGVPIDDKKWKELRKFYNLNSLPPTVHSSPKDLKEVQNLLKITPFKNLIDVEALEKEIKETQKAKKEEVIIPWQEP